MMDVIAAGHLCVDIIPSITDTATATSDNFLAPGRLTEVGGAMLSMGGSVSNTGLSLLRLGMKVRFLARIGDDPIANLTRDILDRKGPGLAQDLVVARGEPSSYTIVISPPGIDRTFLHCPGTNNTFGPEDVPYALLGQTRLFHFGYPPLMRRMFADGGVELSTILARAKEQGATTSLDMAMPDPTQPSGRADWPGIMARALPFVDLFLPSAEELLYTLQRTRFDELRTTVGAAGMLDALTVDEVADLAQQALALGPKVVVLKLGHRGLYVRTAMSMAGMGRGAPADPANWHSREIWAPCFVVDVVNTVGAGDATIAGFLTALLRGQSIEGAARTAVGVGACNVEAADATSGVRSWEETQERIAAGWPNQDASLCQNDWRWHAQRQLWFGPREAGH